MEESLPKRSSLTAVSAYPVPVLVSVVAVSAVVYAALAVGADVPRFFMDELYYMKAGVSLAQGHGLAFEGTSWGYGPLYPLLVAAVVRATSDQTVTYEVLKVANSLFFALTAVPVYLVARRILRPWSSVAAVAASAVIPSTMYASVAMTEGIGYFLASWALLAILRALESPTVARQLVALGSCGVAAAARPQLVALYAGYLLGLAVLALASVESRARLRSTLPSLWPTGLSVVAGIGWVLWPIVHGRGVGAALGSYSSLATSYHPLAIGKWLVYETGDLALYLGVVPLVITPVVVAHWWRSARTGSSRDAAMLSLFTAQALVGVGLIGAFASTPAGLGILYDRYLFYLVPLWLIVFLAWIDDGLPRPAVPFAVGAGATFVAVAALPTGIVGGQSWFRHFEAVATEIWGKVDIAVARLPVGSLRPALVGYAAVCVAVVGLPPLRRARVVVPLVALALAANLALAWHSAFVARSGYGLGSGPATWVDDRVGQHADVTAVVVGRACPQAGVERFATIETDFFNRSVRRLAFFGGEGGGSPSALVVRPDGRLARRSGELLVADYVVVPAGIRLAGAELATGMGPGLALWRVDRDVRVLGADARRQRLSSRCSSSA